jgi:hypothetical protein
MPRVNLLPNLGGGEARRPLRERLAAPAQVLANGGRQIATTTRQTWGRTVGMLGFGNSENQTCKGRASRTATKAPDCGGAFLVEANRSRKDHRR